MSVQQEAFALARLMFDPKAQWHDAAKILSNLSDEPEAVRYVILGYARKVLLGGKAGSARAAAVIERFQFNLYESKHAGLALCCYQLLTAKR